MSVLYIWAFETMCGCDLARVSAVPETAEALAMELRGQSWQKHRDLGRGMHLVLGPFPFDCPELEILPNKELNVKSKGHR